MKNITKEIVINQVKNIIKENKIIPNGFSIAEDEDGIVLLIDEAHYPEGDYPHEAMKIFEKEMGVQSIINHGKPEQKIIYRFGKSLENYFVPDGEAKLNLYKKYMNNFSIHNFQNLISAKAIEWNKENIPHWDFYDTGETFFIIPSEEKIYTANTCYNSVETDRITFGVALSIYCINHMAWIIDAQAPKTKEWQKEIENFSNQFYSLRNFVLEDDNELEGLDISQMLNILD